MWRSPHLPPRSGAARSDPLDIYFHLSEGVFEESPFTALPPFRDEIRRINQYIASSWQAEESEIRSMLVCRYHPTQSRRFRYKLAESYVNVVDVELISMISAGYESSHADHERSRAGRLRVSAASGRENCATNSFAAFPCISIQAFSLSFSSSIFASINVGGPGQNCIIRNCPHVR